MTPITLEEQRYWEVQHHRAFEMLKLPQFRDPICAKEHWGPNRHCDLKKTCQEPWSCKRTK